MNKVLKVSNKFVNLFDWLQRNDSAGPETRGVGKRLLILEDDEDMRESLLEALEDLDFDVTGAASSHQALELARRSRFDLVIHDVRMAEMDGLEAMAGIRQLQPDIKAIVITGYADDSAPTRAIQQRASDYIYKPFQLRELIKVIENVLSAEELARRNDGIMEKLSRGFQALRSRLTARRWESVRQLRLDTYQAYFVGVRSRKLDERNARRLWYLFEPLEGLWLQEREQDLDTLEQRYQYILDLLGALDRQELQLNEVSKSIDADLFAGFYRRLQEGKLALHQLTMAAFLRSVDRVTLLQFPDMQELRRLVWGQPQE